MRCSRFAALSSFKGNYLYRGEINMLKVATVNFVCHTANKDDNLKTMISQINRAADINVKLIVFPELCLTGYDALTSDKLTREEKLALCDDKDSEYISQLAELAVKRDIYVVFGFGERVGDRVYNSAMIATPEGERHIYRKIHLFGNEGRFFESGSEPLLFDTRWGKMGIGICFDTYTCPELLRYYANKGAVLYLNPTAMALEERTEDGTKSFWEYYRTIMEYNVINTGMFVVSSNLLGRDDTSYFEGGSVIMGVGESRLKRPTVHYYGGSMGGEQHCLSFAYVDTKKHNPRLFVPSAVTGETAFKPKLYADWYSV
jgi:predicted amidohydrolase